MERSLSSTIEKIKIQEQDKEAKLEEQREIDASLISLNRAIREITSQVEKSEQEQKVLANNIGNLHTKGMLKKIHRDALITQLDALNKQLEDLRAQTNEGISKVWKERSTFCNDIHAISDKYDVRALLMKPMCIEPIIQSTKKQEDINSVFDGNRLQAAIERRENALKERDRLKSEPDNGEEFLRIRNALRYSLERIEELKK